MGDIVTLKACNLFRGFSENGLNLVGKIARERTIPAGTPIFVENMVAESMFIVKMGVVHLSVKTPTGKDVVLDKLTTGEAFGELSLIIGGHRLVTASAGTDCELLEIPRRDFAKLQKQKPQACLKLMIAIVSQFGKRLNASRDHLKPLLTSQIGE